MIDTGLTLRMAAETLKQNGAAKVYALIAHGKYWLVLIRAGLMTRITLGLLAEANFSTIAALPIERLVVYNFQLLTLSDS